MSLQKKRLNERHDLVEEFAELIDDAEDIGGIDVGRAKRYAEKASRNVTNSPNFEMYLQEGATSIRAQATVQGEEDISDMAGDIVEKADEV